jgi:hypothetical protein
MATSRGQPNQQKPLDRDEFIERQVAFQFGDCEAEPELDLAQAVRAHAAKRESLNLHDPATKTFVPAERGEGLIFENGEWDADFGGPVSKLIRMRASRDARLLNGLYDARLDVPAIVDMQDAVYETDSPFPVFQYNRLEGAKNSILWPFDRIHQIGGTGFCSEPDPSESSCAQKSPTVFWRGGIRGFSTYGGETRHIRSIVTAYLRKFIDEETMQAHLNTLPRYVFISRYFNEPGFDVGFTTSDTHQEYKRVPAIARYLKPYVPKEEQLGHRYQVTVSGNDVGSSFGWQIGTNCVILRESYPWQVFFEGHFQPWEHYVPIARDFADVQEKIAWCEAHLDACQAMVEKRHQLVTYLLEPRTRRKALRRVIKRYEEFYRNWASS